MKPFRNFILFSFVLLAISFLNTLPTDAGTKYCPSGYTYNQSANRCEAPPQCPSSGSYDSSKKQCLADATFTCPSDWYSLVILPNVWGLSCIGDIPCDCGGTVYILNCGVGCKLGYWPCSCGYNTTINDPEKGACRKSPTCPNGGQILVDSGPRGTDPCTFYCYHPVNVSCPSGYSYWPYYKICYATPKCPNGGYLNESLNICTASPYDEPFNDNCNTMVGNPVSVGNGKVVTKETDFSLAGVMPINFTRFYNNVSTSIVKGFGPIWGHNFDMRVISTYYGTSIYKVINPDGSVIYYNDNNGDRVYEADVPKGETSILIKNPNNTFKRVFKDGTSQEFNTAGYLTAVVDRNGNRITLTRDAYNQQLTKVTDPAGREINIAYNASLVSQITLPDGKMITYAYPAGILQKVTYPDGTYKTYEYQYGTYNLTGIKNEKGNYIEKHTYDAQGRAITSSADGTNEKLTIAYISDTQSTVTDSLGRVTTYTIDKTKGKSHATNISGPGCKTCGEGNVSYTYDSNLNITSITDGNGDVTTMTYDSKGNMLTKTEASGTANQRTTTYTYEPNFNQVTSITDPKGNITSFSYDSKGNLISTTDATGATTSFTRNTQGLITQITDAQGNTINYTYDQYGNPSSITDSLGNITTYTYDIMGTLLSMTDANGNQTTYTYDLRKKLTQVRDSLNQLTTYTYDPAGNLTALTDAKGNATQFVYDSINRLIRETNALGRQRNYTYDTQSNLTSKTDAAGRVTTYSYNDYNRLTTITHPGGTQTTFSYDNIGNITSASNPNIAYTMIYDALNRKTSITDSLSRIINYTYDANSNKVSMTDPMGGVTQYTYNPLNKVASIRDPLGHLTSYTYDSLGRRTGTILPNGITNSYNYDSISRLLSIINGSISSNSYVYDNVGNRTSMTNIAGTHNYGYDAIYRLMQATHPAPPTEQFSYDSVGNRLTDSSGNSYFYNNANQLLNFDAVTFEYDANGNTTSVTTSCGTTTYTWDTENRLIGINGFSAQCSPLSASYKYDPFGRRIEKNVNGAVTKYVYGNEDIIVEYDGNNQLIASYTHGPGIDEPIAMTNGQTYYYHTDALGSIIAITDSNRNVVQRYEYDSFGNIVSVLDPNFIQPYTYTAREYDPETGLYYYRARYYDAEVGRFISEDPIGFKGGINKFSYVKNNPVNYTDALGLKEGCGPFGIALPVYTEIHTCCVDHDRCYKNCEKSKCKCDTEFCDCMKRNCSTLPFEKRRICLKIADDFCGAAKGWGSFAYLPSCGRLW